MKKILLAVVIGVVALAGVLFFVTHKKTNEPTTAPTSSTADTSSTAPSTTNTEPKTADSVASTSVAIKDFAFGPKTVTVKKGTTVTWTNSDSMPHTVTTSFGAPEAFDSGSMANGKSFTHTFNTVGTYDYVCTFHASMKGVVVVTE